VHCSISNEAAPLSHNGFVHNVLKEIINSHVDYPDSPAMFTSPVAAFVREGKNPGPLIDKRRTGCAGTRHSQADAPSPASSGKSVCWIPIIRRAEYHGLAVG
jgi:hypothetical protein